MYTPRNISQWTLCTYQGKWSINIIMQYLNVYTPCLWYSIVNKSCDFSSEVERNLAARAKPQSRRSDGRRTSRSLREVESEPPSLRGLVTQVSIRQGVFKTQWFRNKTWSHQQIFTAGLWYSSVHQFEYEVCVFEKHHLSPESWLVLLQPRNVTEGNWTKASPITFFFVHFVPSLFHLQEGKLVPSNEHRDFRDHFQSTWDDKKIILELLCAERQLRIRCTALTQVSTEWHNFLNVPNQREEIFLQVVELFHPVGRFEVLWDCVVETGDDLVDLFLPRLLGVLASADGLEELAQGRLHHGAETGGNLHQDTKRNPTWEEVPHFLCVHLYQFWER